MGLRQAAALRRALAGLAALLLLTGCSPDGSKPQAHRSPSGTVTSSAKASEPTTPKTTRTRTPTPRPTPQPRPRLDTWRVGAHPLPLRPDGYGQVLPTPKQLRVRVMPTRDLLPPPRDGRFHATVAGISPAVRKRMGKTWSPGCPVPLSGLRYLTVSFRGFDGRPHTGELVVSASVSRDVVTVFHRLFDASYPIEEMRLPTTADLEAPPTGDGNNTAAYVCRATRGTSTFSAHAYGVAIDVNPFINPYHRVEKGPDLVLPELASAYLDRSWHRPGMILPGGVVLRAFTAVGWHWGGDFRSVSDLMHFSANGR